MNSKVVKNNFFKKETERYIVEYTYIDFEYMILGEKIKNFNDGNVSNSHKAFNDAYFECENTSEYVVA